MSKINVPNRYYGRNFIALNVFIYRFFACFEGYHVQTLYGTLFFVGTVIITVNGDHVELVSLSFSLCVRFFPIQAENSYIAI